MSADDVVDGTVLTTDEKVDVIYRDIAEIRSLVEKVVEQVGPTLDQLARHPMLKMFLK